MSAKTYYLSSKEALPPLHEDWEPRREAAQSLRRIIEMLATRDTTVGQSEAIAEQLRAVESLFEGSASIEGKVAWAERYGLDSFGKVGTELDPFRGESNPVSLPSRFWIEDDKAFATYRANWAYEGPPGRMHGGYVAAIFDNFLGMAQVMDGKPGMTGTLKVNYHRATPLNTELSLEAEIVKAEGRTKVLRGVMMANGERTATCEGLFIQPKNGFHAQTSPEA